MKTKISAIIGFIFPSSIAITILNWMGHHIHKSGRIGFSWLQCQEIHMAANSKIGHFNLIRITSTLPDGFKKKIMIIKKESRF